MNVLDEIVAYKRTLLDSGYYEQKLQTLSTVDISAKKTLSHQLENDPYLTVIAELKAKSPTVSNIPKRDMLTQLQQYERYGAGCVSILTDERYFAGSFERLHTLTQQTALPVLCKDFIIDTIQLKLAKQAGASVILLIVHILDDQLLQDLYQQAIELGLEVLVEVHDETELNRAHHLGASIIGVNNRDLTSFITDIHTTGRLLAQKLPNRYYISESGIHTPTDVQAVQKAGIDGVLVGESLMKSDDLQTFLPQLRLQKQR